MGVARRGRRTTIRRRGAVFAYAAMISAGCLLTPSEALAQQASGIAGVVRDTSGGVLPGVTVEAASPALIEKVRTVVSDGEGRYNIIDLRPGLYSVTFTLTGFNTLRRDGVELGVGFTATVNAEMRVGALEETVTVSGAVPLVDTQNTRQQAVVSTELLESLPNAGKTVQALAALTPGLGGKGDVGGSVGSYNAATVGNFHGKTGNKSLFDGQRINDVEVTGNAAGYVINPLTVEEMSVETGGASAESSASGVNVNSIPREGGNSFVGNIVGLYSNDAMQSANLTDELRARGLQTTNKLINVWDIGGSVGGPLKRDKLWFFTAHRGNGIRSQVAGAFYNKTQGTMFYQADTNRPMQRYDYFRSNAGRLTWQVSPKNKLSVFADYQQDCVCVGSAASTTNAPEVATRWEFDPTALYQTSWTAPITSKLLVEAGFSATIFHWKIYRQPEVSRDDISILELSNNFRYNAIINVGVGMYGTIKDSDRYSQRASMSYVTGSHAIKVGVHVDQGIHNNNAESQGPDGVGYRFLNGVPNSLDQLAFPFLQKNRVRADLGAFAQDRWAIRRLTLNVGVRFDYLNAYVPEQHLDAGPFVPARDFAPVYGVPAWSDINPRLGVSYDLFGNGRTALKLTVGRYVGLNQADIAQANNPVNTSVNSVNRTWNDINGNYVPDCDLRSPVANAECGPISNARFGQLNITERWDPETVRGFGHRDYNWDLATVVQHEIVRGMSMTAGYYRNWYSNIRTTDNLAVVPTDFSPYCIAAPIDSRLPGGGGYPVCNLYDLAPAKFGLIDNLVTQAGDFGEPELRNDFFTVTFNTRFGGGIMAGGGIDTGRTVTDNCFVVDSPQSLLNCRVVTPFQAQTDIKLNASVPLPGDWVVSGIMQNQSGPQILANYTATNAQIAPSLGRNLAACGSRPVCTSTVTNIPLIQPQTLWEGRRSQLDVRVAKIIRMGSRMRLQANVDLYNIFNASPISSINTSYGSLWLQPTLILDGRLIQVGGRLTF